MNKPITSAPIPVAINWEHIDTVLLDLDGTLLDKYFDDFFWEKFVPQVYAEKHKLTAQKAESALLEKYQSVENTLQWTDLDYWSRRLGLNIPRLKKDINHLIQVHNGVSPFLQFVRSLGKKLCLVTNAHSKTLAIKLECTDIEKYFDFIVCSEEVGKAKEQLQFWHDLEDHLDFEKTRTLFADDTEKVLHSAKAYGIQHLIHIAKPSSQLPLRYSIDFPSIIDFSHLTPTGG